MNIYEGFFERLSQVMAERRLNSSDLARMLNLHVSSIGRWSRGSTPQRNTLTALAKSLRVNPEWLACGRGPRSFSGEVVEQESYQNVMREEPLEPTTPAQSPDVKIMISMLRSMLDDVATQPKPKLSTLLGMRALLGEIMTQTQSLSYHPPSQKS